ncbi:hypothetical protein BTO20_20085 [Mycobacterium dioxanotrophicus]|uniref:Immunity protein Imm33 domain-containing protein n=2 Tax=Mycobacterium dioxanotrophicus TaxID=482462 RepID=A0A1Y0CFJ9_9MYCO|nr:hypothetical protein BTO20_20085 [Mycobacterium dioxanotrophicus]
MERRGRVRWMWRRPSQTGVDNGWRIMSEIDTSEYLNERESWQIVDYNDVCYIEPALVGIWDFEVGSDLEVVRDESGIRIFDIPTGRQIPTENLYVPPQFRARPGEC